MRQLQEYFSQFLISLFAVGEAARTAGEQSSGGTRGLDYSAAWERSAAELLAASPCTLSAPCLRSPIPEPIVGDGRNPRRLPPHPSPDVVLSLGCQQRNAWGAPKIKMQIFGAEGPRSGVRGAKPALGHGQDKAPGRWRGGQPWAFDPGKSSGFSSHSLAQPKSLSLMVFQATRHPLLARCSSVWKVLKFWVTG